MGSNQQQQQDIALIYDGYFLYILLVGREVVRMKLSVTSQTINMLHHGMRQMRRRALINNNKILFIYMMDTSHLYH